MSGTASLAFALALATTINLQASPWPLDRAKARSNARANAEASADQKAPSTSAVSAARNPEGAAASQLPAGTRIEAELQAAIDSSAIKVFDQVVARVTRDVTQDEEIMVRKGDRLAGRVTAIQSTGSAPADSSVTIAFDRLITTHSVMPLNTVLIAVIPASVAAAEAGRAAQVPAAASQRTSTGLLEGAPSSTMPVRRNTLVGDGMPQIASQANSRTGLNSVLSSPGGKVRLEAGTRLQFEVARPAQAIAKN